MVAPLLPPPRPRPKGGRPPVDDRKALTGILFVLKSGIPWAMLPREMGCGSGMTCWRRLRDWQRAGVWQKLHRSTARACRPKGGRAYRPEPDRPRQAGQQAPRPGRGRWHPARFRPDAGERARQRDAGAGARRGAAGPAVPGPAPQAPGQAARRQRLRLPPLPPRLPPARRRPAHRQAWGRQLRAARPAPVGCREDAGLVRPLPPAHGALGAPRRHPRGLPPPRRRPDLPSFRRAVVLLDAVRRVMPSGRRPGRAGTGGRLGVSAGWRDPTGGMM
jgi:transposase